MRFLSIMLILMGTVDGCYDLCYTSIVHLLFSGPGSILGDVQPGRDRSKKKKKKSPRATGGVESVEGDGNFFGSSNSPEPLRVP